MENLRGAERVRAKIDSRAGWLVGRQRQLESVRFRRFVMLLLQMTIGIRQARGFRLVDENGTTVPFAPYEQGFVGR